MITQFTKGFKKGSKAFGENISIIVNSLLLFIVYLIGVGIVSVIAKLSNKRFLDYQEKKSRDTYWSGLNLTQKPIEEYYRQF
ncbi:hypothetical protein JW930_00840 [Candidatus Woesearchaeota archaeon]|nr:hypothetical protein [Candidatus Woesearchaeota archaeon]